MIGRGEITAVIYPSPGPGLLTASPSERKSRQVSSRPRAPSAPSLAGGVGVGLTHSPSPSKGVAGLFHRRGASCPPNRSAVCPILAPIFPTSQQGPQVREWRLGDWSPVIQLGTGMTGSQAQTFRPCLCFSGLKTVPFLGFCPFRAASAA